MARLFDSLLRRVRRSLGLDCPAKQPRDWSDAAGWDAYWRGVLTDTSERSWLAGPLCREPFLDHFIPLMRERGRRRVLFAGNGISLEPHVMAHCGFDVTAVDLSPAACRFVRGYRLTPRQLGWFLPVRRKSQKPSHPSEPDVRATEERVRQEHRPGGYLEVIEADLLRWSPSGPFDVIYAANAIKGCHAPIRYELVRRFFAWLSPGGIAVVSTLHASDTLERDLTAELKAAGFFLHQEESSAWYRAQSWPDTQEGQDRLRQEYQERVAAEVRWEQARLDAGEKQAVFWNSMY